MPGPQTGKQREFEARVKEIGTQMAKRLGMSRRRFFQTAAGMASAFLAMNDTYGPIYGVSRAEAAEPDRANERAKQLSDQFIMDMHTHFLRPGTRIQTFVNQRKAVGKAGWNPALVNKEQTIDDLMFTNYLKEIYLDSDTKIACISGAPSEVPEDWFLTNDMKAQARADVNGLARSKRMFAHAIFTPGYDGWMDQIDYAIATLKPDSMKGYTIGDNTNKNLSKHPWRMDDEKLVYPAYAKFEKAGLRNVCVHKGLFPPSVEKQFPHLLEYSDVRDVAKAAKDWPQLNFIIYHGGYRWAGGGSVEDAWAQFERTGRIEWVTDLSEIPVEVRRQERLRRYRPAVRAIDDRRPARIGGDDRPAHQRDGRGSRVLGHGCDLDRLAAMADRGASPPGNPRRPAEEIRAAAARSRGRSGQDRDLRRQQCASVQRQAGAARRARRRSARALQGALREARRRAHQPGVWLCKLKGVSAGGRSRWSIRGDA